MIDNKRLEQLVRLMIENDLSELDLRDKDETVCLKRAVAPAMHTVPAHIAAPTPNHAGVPAPGAAPVATDTGAGLLAIESPMVGTFYARPNPESPHFVKVGAPIGPDTVVCLIEAMKVFNEVQAGLAGTIERMLVKDGEPVEFGQKLFLVRPN